MPVTINGSAGVTTNSGAVYNGLQTDTAKASTSGTSIDFTSIPSWVKRITVMLDGVSLSGTDSFLVQLGDSGGIETTGYVSTSTSTTASAGGTLSSTSGFAIRAATAANLCSGHMVLTNITGNTWISSHCATLDGSTAGTFGGGTKTLSATLDRVSVTRTGTNTFDAGTINIIYE